MTPFAGAETASVTLLAARQTAHVWRLAFLVLSSLKLSLPQTHLDWRLTGVSYPHNQGLNPKKKQYKPPIEINLMKP